MNSGTALVDEAPSDGAEASVQAVVNAAAVEALRGRFVWRQERREWWVKQANGIWCPEAVEELTAALKGVILEHWPDKYSATLVGGVKQLLKSDLAIDAGAFDRDPWLLGVQNGIVDLGTLELIDGEDEHYITRCCDASYVRGQHNELWESHILNLFDGDEEIAKCFQKQIGAALVGDAETVKPQVFLQLVGASGGGKGTTSRTLRSILGSYARSYSSKDFSAGQDRHKQWLTTMDGIRLAIVQEMRTQALDVELLKTLSGGDPVIANEMRMADKEWVPTHTLMFTSNNAPNFDDDTEGMYRRYVPFPTRLPPVSGGAGSYEEALRADPDGILMWALRGTALWISEDRKGTIKLPDVIRELRDADIDDQSIQAEFIEEYISFGSGEMLRSEVKAKFSYWLANEKQDFDALTKNDKRLQKLYDLIRHMGAKDRQFTVRGKPSQRGWEGAAMK